MLGVGPALFGGGGPLSITTVLGSAVISTNTLVLTLSEAVPAGVLFAPMVAIYGNGRTLTGCADDRGNTYTVDATVTNGSTAGAHICSSVLGTALQSGDNVTLTFSGSLVGISGGSMIEAKITNAAPSSPKDKSGTGTGSSNSPSSSAGTVTIDKEISLSVLCWGTTSGFSEDSGWTTLVSTGIGGAKGGAWGYKIRSAIGSENRQPTITSSSWAQAVVTYKGN